MISHHRVFLAGLICLLTLASSTHAAEKDHANVMRDIRALEMSSDLKTSWFRPVVVQEVTQGGALERLSEKETLSFPDSARRSDQEANLPLEPPKPQVAGSGKCAPSHGTSGAASGASGVYRPP